ncbi:uncharacterized protein [Antedon mediterranea]|uniref:uncharacterized protein isoform X2 n=1 Tax=Antedon mediterranea TaxID=105859 RepID=UPI003AF9BFBC
MANVFIYFRVLIHLVAIGIHNGFAADTYLTVFNTKSPFANFGQYQCYPSETGTTITFGRAFKIASSDSTAEQPGRSHLTVNAKILDVPIGSENAFGAYYCKGVVGGEETIVYTTIVDTQTVQD